jgi:hypothetical protein
MHIAGNILVRAPGGCFYLHSGRDNVVENNVLVDGTENQMSVTGWTTSTGFWSSMVDGWIEKYEAAVQHEAWRSVPTLADPRDVPLPDGRVMHGNVFRRNIFCYRNPTADLWRFRTVQMEQNRSDRNLIYHYGLPISTGESVVKREIGPNLLSDPGLEDGPANQWPDAWGWRSSPGEGTRVEVADADPHSGEHCLLVDPGMPDEVATATGPLYVAPGSIPFQPGKAYRFRAWLRSERPSTKLMLSVYSWKKETHNWLDMQHVAIGKEWHEYEAVVRLPDVADPDYKPTMGQLWARFDIPPDAGRLWIDDVSLREVELSNEWEGWLATGQDAHSIIADPLFVDPGADDYRLRPESPAFDLGFEPIPVDEIGPYEDELRATWPILEAEGARELLN